MRASLPLCLLALALAGCRTGEAGAPGACGADTGGVKLAEGFCATVFADGVGVARHMVVDADGTLYVALSHRSHGGGIAVLRDTDGDGLADQVQYFGDTGGSGIGIHDGWLYLAADTEVLRYELKPGEAVPAALPQTVVDGFPQQDEHAAKTITFDDSGHLYVNVGAPSNACQQDDRAAGSPGIAPCPLLEEHGGIWRFDADTPHQRFPQDGTRYATGIRNAVALTWGGARDGLYVLQMGRDQLSDNWPSLYTDTESAELPAEEFFQVHSGDDFGWPYCYYDSHRSQKLRAPEYGGDGKQQGDCGKYGQPIAVFPGHWAPEAVLFYSGRQFPARYQGGAFITFHGSWNRAPLAQAGFKVVFLPFEGGRPSAPYEVFADGFAGSAAPASPGDAKYRPMGLAQGPDGSLYIGDTQTGRIWRVTYSPQH
ncbi:MAG TPA: PQQ-dependent sugar dehydrogenase [Gammaproteobacteria bacterium]